MSMPTLETKRLLLHALCYGFDELQALEIIRLLYPENKASNRAAERIGAEFSHEFMFYNRRTLLYRSQNESKPARRAMTSHWSAEA